MKKFAIFVLSLLSVFSFLTIVQAEDVTTEVYIHYYRYEQDYTDWNLWVWQNQPESLEGESFSFVDDDTSNEYNYGGVVSKITLTGNLADATRLGFIVRKGNWLEKDIDSDRFITIPETSVGGIYHAYLVEGDARIGSSLSDPDGPDRAPKFKSAYFTQMNEIYFSATEVLTEADIQIKKDDVVISTSEMTFDGMSGTITINETVDFTKKYEIVGTFSDDSINTLSITFDGIYDSEEFEAVFGYDGDDLGSVVTEDKTTFRVWAPVSDQITINFYETGTPLSLGGSDTPYKQVEMTPDVNGTFYYEELGNLHGKYYTYSVKNGLQTNEVVDPYAKSTGINGLRGLVVDFDQVNPEGFTYNTRANNMSTETDAIIYELHVRDLTTHSSWNGLEMNRGKYLGLIEEGTTYEGVPTGFDHIKALGITHIQLLPFFDYGVVDESKLDDETYNSFNWGYMPLNFNTLEGTYSSDPYDGLVRISEMKQVVMALTENNIRLNMDVVYNHTGLTADSNFSLIVPGYYYRKTASGAYSNGSGTGNETASDRIMMQKFMVDSVSFWAEEYNISGFRFDLMALHDIDTMNLIASTLKAIDPTIMIYGEPWTGGTTPLSASLQAGKTNLALMPQVGAFNDDLRDAVKGSVFAREQGGFIQGDFSLTNLTRVKYGITGGISYPGVSGSLLSNTRIWHTSPTKTINYVTAHDNNTLYDKLYLTLEEDELLDLIPSMSKQANAIVLTSQGISFLHAGDEFLRSKPLENGNGFDHNSYESPDVVNQLRWDELVKEVNYDVFEYYQGLIALRKQHASFRMDQAQDIIDNLTFVYEDTTGLIAYTIKNDASSDDLALLMVLHNSNQKAVRITLPKNGGWVEIVNGDDSGVTELTSYLGGQTIKLQPNSSYVLYQDVNIGDYSATPLILSITGGVVVLLGGVFIVLKVIRKKG